MKRALGAMLILGIVIGCKGGKGDKGDRGDRGDRGIQGLTGPSGSFELVSGSVSGNSFTVSDSRFSSASQITVYIGDAVALSELPYYLPGPAVNAYFLFKPATNSVEIYNAQLAGAVTYIIAVS